MDLLSIVRVVWRHKIAIIPVILFTLAGMYYVLAVKPPVYNSSTSLLLVNPPNPPSAQQIVADPKLAKINSNNPYVNDGLQTVADVLVNLIGSDASKASLLAAGADPQYQVALSNDFGNPPIIDVTGVASNAPEAVKSASLVTNALISDLYQMQKNQNVSDIYLIKGINLIPAHGASLTISSKLRTLIAVVGLGALLMLIVISTAEALGRPRSGSSAAPRPTAPNLDNGSMRKSARALSTRLEFGSKANATSGLRASAFRRREPQNGKIE